MKKLLAPPEPPKRLQQTCPLCGEVHGIMMRGLVVDMETFKPVICGDKGYSFCNCHNIFYTNWSNIDKTIYDTEYVDRYKHENIRTIAVNEIEKFYPILDVKKDNSSFIELGAIHDHVLDYVKAKGVTETVGLDIMNHDSKHEFICSDFEDYEPQGRKFDIIYASHIFEHFKDPGKQLDKCKEMLTPDGKLYIAMPETFFIDFKDGNGINFDWYVQQHHILWNMDNWIDYCKEHGFRVLYSERNTDLHKQNDDNWFWKADFKVILCKE